jgi:hypothetical protein
MRQAKPSDKQAKLTRLNLRQVARSFLATVAIGSLVLFIGAVRPEGPRRLKISTMPRPTRTLAFANPTPVNNDAELLHDAVTASFSTQPLIDFPHKPRLLRMEVTAYCPCTKCCGPNAQRPARFVQRREVRRRRHRRARDVHETDHPRLRRRPARPGHRPGRRDQGQQARPLLPHSRRSPPVGPPVG